MGATDEAWTDDDVSVELSDEVDVTISELDEEIAVLLI